MSPWKNHWLDSLLFGVSVVQFATVAAWAVSFESLSPLANLGVGLFAMLLLFHNWSVVSHEFCHRPWFKADWANRCCAVFNSVNLGYPVLLYNFVHLAHHRYDNGPLDPTSTYRFGKDGKQEHWFRYAILGVFRDDTKYALREVKKHGKRRQLAFEVAAVVLGLAAWVAISWRFFLLAYVPLFFWGQFIVRISAYFGHFNATDVNDRYANSVNYYGRLWNLLMFNEGYHQEHHIRPQEHWSERSKTTRDFADEMQTSDTYVESFPPMFNLLAVENPRRRTAEEPAVVPESEMDRAA